jgi:hypothetical protein
MVVVTCQKAAEAKQGKERWSSVGLVAVHTEYGKNAFRRKEKEKGRSTTTSSASA